MLAQYKSFLPVLPPKEELIKVTFFLLIYHENKNEICDALAEKSDEGCFACNV